MARLPDSVSPLIPSRFTLLLLALNSARDQGRELPAVEVRRALEEGNVLDRAEAILGAALVSRLLDEATRDDVSARLSDIWHAMGPRGVGRRLGAEKTGIGILMAVTIEAAQQQTAEPSE